MQLPSLLIEAGIHEGLRTTLGEGVAVVGTEFANTVVIADPAMEKRHFEITVSDKIKLAAVDGAVSLPDAKVLQPGESLVCKNSVRFLAGETWFNLDLPMSAPRAAKHAGAGKPAGRLSMMSGMVMLVATGVLIFTAAGLRSGDASPTTVPHHPVVLKPVASARAAAEALRAHLDEAGLTMISIQTTHDGSVVTQGLLLPPQIAAWNEIRRWYDGAFGASRMLVDQVMPMTAGPKMAIAAVWQGANPYIVNERGEKLYAGAPIGDGWKIESISAGKVTVLNGPQKAVIRY